MDADLLRYDVSVQPLRPFGRDRRAFLADREERARNQARIRKRVTRIDEGSMNVSKDTIKSTALKQTRVWKEVC